MSSIRSHLVRSLVVKHYLKKALDLEKQTIEQMRQKFIDLSKRTPHPKDTVIEKTTIAGLPAEWVTAAGAAKENKKVILHFHGGGVAGSCETHRLLASLISKAAGVRVLL